jgi:hypothetical protein
MREIVVVIKIDDEDEDNSFKDKTDEEIIKMILEKRKTSLIEGWYILDEH